MTWTSCARPGRCDSCSCWYSAHRRTWERSTQQAVELSMQAIELARRHGWAEEPVTPRPPMWCSASHRSARAGWSRQKSWLDRAERAVRPEVQPAEGIPAHYARGAIKLACGREHEALAASGLPNGWPGCSSRRTRWQGGPGRSRCTLSCGSGRPGWWNRPWPGWMNSSKRPLRCAASWGAATRSGSPTGRGRCARARCQRITPSGEPPYRTGSGFPAGGDNPGRAWRHAGRRACP